MSYRLAEERRVEEMDEGTGREEEEGKEQRKRQREEGRDQQHSLRLAQYINYFHPPYCSLWNQLLLFLEVLVRVEEHLVTIRSVP